MPDLATRIPSKKRGWAHPGSSHDRMIRLLLIALPAAIGVLAAFLVIAPLTMGGEMSFLLDKNRVDVAKERLRIESADYRGVDAKGQAFRLHAGSAIQQSSAKPVVELNDLQAEIKLPEGPASIVAPKGSYDLNTEQVAVDGQIRFKTSDGYVLNTQDATVDLKTRTMESGGAVRGNTPLGVFSGNKMSADLEKRTVSLDGNARLRIFPKRANRR